MRITINLDTHAVSTTPSPLRIKAASEVPIELEFRRGNQPTAMPDGTLFDFTLKPKGKSDAAVLVRHTSFASAAGNLHSAAVSTNTRELLAAIQSFNDQAALTTDAEIGWTIDGSQFRSQTFAIIVEAALYRSGENLPADAEPPYPQPSAIELKSNKGAPDGYAGLGSDGKIIPSQLPGHTHRQVIPSGETFVVPAGESLICAGWLDVEGTLEIQPGGIVAIL